MSKWGNVLEQAKQRASILPEMTFFDHKGNKVLTAPLPLDFEGFPILFTSRGEMQVLFYKYAVSIGIKFHFDSRITKYFEEDTVAGIYCGYERFEADGVISADGVHSLGRTIVTGHPQRPKGSGFAIYRAWFSLDDLANDPMTKHYSETDRDMFHVWLGTNTHAIVLTNIALRALVVFVTHKVCCVLLPTSTAQGRVK